MLYYILGFTWFRGKCGVLRRWRSVTTLRQIDQLVFVSALWGVVSCTAVAFLLYYSLIDQVGEERAALGN